MNLNQLNEMLPILGTIIGWIALGLVCAYSIPQLYKVLKTKNTSGLSVFGYCFFIISNMGMLAWGVGNAIRTLQSPGYDITLTIITLLPNITLNCLNITINVMCLTIKINHLLKAKKMGIDEEQLSILLLKKKNDKKKKRGA